MGVPLRSTVLILSFFPALHPSPIKDRFDLGYSGGEEGKTYGGKFTLVTRNSLFPLPRPIKESREGLGHGDRSEFGEKDGKTKPDFWFGRRRPVIRFAIAPRHPKPIRPPGGSPFWRLGRPPPLLVTLCVPPSAPCRTISSLTGPVFSNTYLTHAPKTRTSAFGSNPRPPKTRRPQGGSRTLAHNPKNILSQKQTQENQDEDKTSKKEGQIRV